MAERQTAKVQFLPFAVRVNVVLNLFTIVSLSLNTNSCYFIYVTYTNFSRVYFCFIDAQPLSLNYYLV